MADEPANLVLEDLLHIRAGLDDVKREVRDLKDRQSAVEVAVVGLRRDIVSLEETVIRMNGRIDRLDGRAERIERRLELTDAQPTA